MSKFSKVEKDEKSFTLISFYLNEFKTGKSKDEINGHDLRLQHKEIQDHIRNHNLDPNDKKIAITWVDENGVSYREYLNACKLIAFMIHGFILFKKVKKSKINKDYIFKIIEVYGNYLYNDLDTIY